MSETKIAFNKIMNGVSGGVFSGIGGTGVFGIIGAVAGAIVGEIGGMAIGGIIGGPAGSIVGATEGAKILATMGAAVFGGYGGVAYFYRGAKEGYNGRLSMKKMMKSLLNLEIPKREKTTEEIIRESSLSLVEKRLNISKKRALYGAAFGMGVGVLATIFCVGVGIPVVVDVTGQFLMQQGMNLLKYLPVILGATTIVGIITGAIIGNNTAKREIRALEREKKRIQRRKLSRGEVEKTQAIAKTNGKEQYGKVLTKEEKDDYVAKRSILYGILGIGAGIVSANLLMPVVAGIVGHMIYLANGFQYAAHMEMFSIYLGVGMTGGAVLGARMGYYKGELEIETMEKQQIGIIERRPSIDKDKLKTRELSAPEIDYKPQIEKSNKEIQNDINKQGTTSVLSSNIPKTQNVSKELTIVKNQVARANDKLIEEVEKNKLISQLDEAEEQLRAVSLEITRKKEQLADINKELQEEKQKLIDLTKSSEIDNIDRRP